MSTNLTYLEKEILSLIKIKPRTRKELVKLTARNRTHVYDAILKLNTQMHIGKKVLNQKVVFYIPDYIIFS